MGIREFFHRIRIGFIRRREASIPYTSEAKRYGNQGEENVVYMLQRNLPGCKIKKNVLIQTLEGTAEIDCLVLYKNKLFAIEVKHWKGYLSEYNGNVVQKKIDRWTEEVHVKYHKSPFKQLNRAIYLLRKQIPDRVWINAIVFFTNADSVAVSNDDIWFANMRELIDYIVGSGEESYGANADAFFQKCISADRLYSNSRGESVQCVICNHSLCFQTRRRVLRRKDIREIRIVHHWSYDELHIKTTDGETVYLEAENAKISVVNNGCLYSYALCKIDWIQLGLAVNDLL